MGSCRSSERISNALHEALNLPELRQSTDDDGALFSVDNSKLDMPPLTGIEHKVKLVNTSTGIVLIKESDGQPTYIDGIREAAGILTPIKMIDYVNQIITDGPSNIERNANNLARNIVETVQGNRINPELFEKQFVALTGLDKRRSKTASRICKAKMLTLMMQPIGY